MARALVFATVLGVVAMLSGCGSPAATQPSPRTQSTSTPVEIHAGRATSSTSIRTAAPVPRTARQPTARVAPPAFPAPSEVDQHSIDAVASGGATAMASADTVLDGASPQHTAIRAAAAGWLTPVYAHRVRTATIAGPAGARWDLWSRHRAYLVVTAAPSGEDHPPDTATVASRKVVLREQAIGRDGWHAEPMTAVVVVVLKKVNKVWRIDNDQPS